MELEGDISVANLNWILAALWTAVVAPVGQLRRVVSSKQRIGDLF